MTLIANTINSNSELNTFIQSPTIRVRGEIKKLSFKEIFASAQKVTKRIISLLLFETKDLKLLETIAVQYNKLYDEHNGIEK